MHQTQVIGDTRFDRVNDIRENPRVLDLIESFKQKSRVMVFGSVWPGDMERITPIMEQLLAIGLKLIIAPHEVSPASIESITSNLKAPWIQYANYDSSREGINVLIIDRIGLLSIIYGYGDLAYVGGAFKGTLHNVLEPAVYGIPVLFGSHPSNTKFKEANDLVNLGGAREIKTDKELISEVNLLISDPSMMEGRGKICQNYVTSRMGARTMTIEIISELLTDRT